MFELQEELFYQNFLSKMTNFDPQSRSYQLNCKCFYKNLVCMSRKWKFRSQVIITRYHVHSSQFYDSSKDVTSIIHDP